MDNRSWRRRVGVALVVMALATLGAAPAAAQLGPVEALSLYLTHEPTGGYLGLRTGFKRTDALQVVDAERQVYRGRGVTTGIQFPVR